MSKKGDLGSPFEGWTRKQLLLELQKEGLEIPDDSDDDLLVSYALEHYASIQKQLPKPPTKKVTKTRRHSNRRSRRSQGSVFSNSTNSKTLTRRVRNSAGRESARKSKQRNDQNESVGTSQAPTRASEDEDIIDMLLDQVENDGLSINSQSYYSKPSTTVRKAKPNANTTTLREQEPKQTTRVKRVNGAYNTATKPRNRNRYSGGINDFGEYDAALALEDAAWFAFSLGDPSVVAAKDYAKRFHPIDYDGEKYFVFNSTAGRLCMPDSYCCDVFEERNESDFAKYGVGISIYFKWLKWLFWMFFTISILSFPQMFFNINGAGESVDFSNFQSIVFSSSIGNLLDDSLTLLLLDSNETIFEDIGSAFPNATLLLPGFECDGVPCEIDRQTVQRMYLATDILVTLSFLIGAIYLRYFTIIEYGLLQKSFRKIEQYTLRIRNLPKDVTEAELESFLKRQVTQDVHDVVLARDDGQIIELYQERGKFITKMWQLVGEAKRLIEAQDKRVENLSILNIDAYNAKVASYVHEYNQKKLEIGAKYDEAFAHFLSLDERRKRCKLGENVVTGFVTFETADAFDKAGSALEKKSCWKPKRRKSLSAENINVPKLKGKKLYATAAQPPSTIIWENMEYSRTQQCCRQVSTGVVTLILLSITFSIAFLTQSFRVELSSSARNLTLAALCDEFDPEIFEINTPPVGTNEELFIDCKCSLLSFTEAGGAILNNNDICHDFWSDLAPIYIFTSFASMIIATVSVFLSVSTRALANFERHRSIQSKELSIGSRLYIALFINVGLALLLVNANFEFGSFSIIGNGRYSDFESEWYANVGVQIFLTTLINSFSPHSIGFLSFTLQKIKQLFSQPKLQAEMNKNYLGSEFAASYRYAQQMTALSVTMIYGAGIPLFYLLAIVNFSVYFWVDKYLFLRFYQTPPDFGDKLAKFASRLMLFLVPVHASISLYMYTTPGLFLVTSQNLTEITGSEFVETTFERFTITASIPHLLLIIIGVIVFILDTLFVITSKTYNHQQARVTEDKDFENVSTGKSNGQFATFLNSYNILERRKYMNAFGISPIFARENKGVQGLFTNSGEQNMATVPDLPNEIRIYDETDVDHAALLGA